MIYDYGKKDLEGFIPQTTGGFTWPLPDPEIEALKARVAALEEALQAAREYDRKTNQPDCDDEEKKAALQKIADQLGIEIKFPE